jgi:hypothetical protein
MILLFNLKSGNKLEITLKTELTPIGFRQLLTILQRDKCITDSNLCDGCYYINMDEVETVSMTEKKTNRKLIKE